MSWSDDKELSSKAKIIGLNYLKKKKKNPRAIIASIDGPSLPIQTSD